MIAAFSCVRRSPASALWHRPPDARGVPECFPSRRCSSPRLSRDEESPSLDLEPDDGFEQLLGDAVHYRIATGPHTGRKALTLRTVGSNPPAEPRIPLV